jgi:hypothetical protein
MEAPIGIATHDQSSNPRYLFRQPRALQWFEGGRLFKRHDNERAAGETAPPPAMQSWTLTVVAGRFELFLDLLYVGILSSFADTLVEDISGAKLVKYLVRRAQGASLNPSQESIH